MSKKEIRKIPQPFKEEDEADILFSPTNIELKALTDEDDLKGHFQTYDETDGEGKRPGIERVTSVNSAGETPLMRAIRRGASLTSLFLQQTKPADVLLSETDRYQRNAFHYAITKPDVVKSLLEQFKTNPSINDVLRHEDKEGETPIHRAARTGNTKSLEILHEYDNSLIKLKTKDTGTCVLHCAVKSGLVDTVQFVLSKDFDQLDQGDKMLRTALFFAAKLKQKDMLAFLITKGADTMARDGNNQVALHAAANRGLLNNVELLVQEDPDCIDLIDDRGQTALLLAAMKGFPSVVIYLLDCDADYRIKDHEGMTPFDWATKLNRTGVIGVFIDQYNWKEVINESKLGPEKCLKMLVENQSEVLAKTLLDKCITVKGSEQDPTNYQVTYDFFCLETRDKNKSCPRFEALSFLAKSKCEDVLSHPVAVKYVEAKWRKRGFKFSLATIFVAVLFHICLMVYTTKVCGTVTMTTQHILLGGKNMTRTTRIRKSEKPDKDFMILLRVILVVITCGSMFRELCKVIVQREAYFLALSHYVQWALFITVMFYVLPVNQKITPEQLGSGSLSVFLSWIMLIEFLRILPVLGVYISAVKKVFWTLIKIFIVVLIFLMSFSSTFYVLLAEHSSFENLSISLVSTFMAMMSGPDYQTLFVETGWYPQLYNLKLFILVLFVLVMCIVVNNTLIGLAVGDTDEVMKSARIDKFRRKAEYIVYMEKFVNSIPGFHVAEDECFAEFPKRKKKTWEKVLDLIYTGGKLDTIDGQLESHKDSEKDEHEKKESLEDYIENILTIKVESARLSLHCELSKMAKEMTDHSKKDEKKRKELQDKVDKILEKLMT